MYAKWGYEPFAWNIRDRAECITSAVTVEVSVLGHDVRNGMDEATWAGYVKSVIRQEFPDMSGLTENVRYMAILVEMSKKSAKFADEWFDTAWPDRTYSDRLVELYRRRERSASSESREFERIVQKAWRWAIRRSGWDYDRSRAFIANVENKVISYQTRHMDA